MRGWLVRGAEEGQGAGPGKSPTSSPSLVVPTGPQTLFSQGCRNPGTFPLEVASWAFHPRVLGGCNMPHEYLPNQERLLEAGHPTGWTWLGLSGSDCVLGPDGQVWTQPVFSDLYSSASPSAQLSFLSRYHQLAPKGVFLAPTVWDKLCSTEGLPPSSPPARGVQEPACANSRELTVFTSSQLCSRCHNAGSLKSAMVGAFTP